MIFVFFSIVCSVSIAHLFKYIQRRTLPMFGIFAVNYFVGSLIALIGTLTSSRGNVFQKFSPALLSLGVIVGILFFCSYILLTSTIQKLGVTIPVSLMRVSAVIPTVGSIIVFHTFEVPTTLQIIGIILAFASLPLASEERIVFTNLRQILNNGFGWGLMLFCVFGSANFIFKIQHHLFSLENPYIFLMIVFPTAFLVSLGVAIFKKTRMTRIVLQFGVVLGTLNLFTSYFLMKALHDLPGIVVYPTNGIGIILLSAMTSLVLWKERLKPSNYGFIAFASVALLLIYPR